ncbi:hypothetical protein JW758_03880 [Candidatus Peregrinibacteria bacterium]|nr:hypothetical protein [Candidatus Peregrinibacteria bacterium]
MTDQTQGDTTQLSADDYIDRVYEAFNKHCELIHEETIRKIDATEEGDVEGRKKILEDQKIELDKTLAELKTVLNAKTRETRKKMEESEKALSEKEFNLEEELASV